MNITEVITASILSHNISFSSSSILTSVFLSLHRAAIVATQQTDSAVHPGDLEQLPKTCIHIVSELFNNHLNSIRVKCQQLEKCSTFQFLSTEEGQECVRLRCAMETELTVLPGDFLFVASAITYNAYPFPKVVAEIRSVLDAHNFSCSQNPFGKIIHFLPPHIAFECGLHSLGQVPAGSQWVEGLSHICFIWSYAPIIPILEDPTGTILTIWKPFLLRPCVYLNMSHIGPSGFENTSCDECCFLVTVDSAVTSSVLDDFVTHSRKTKSKFVLVIDSLKNFGTRIQWPTMTVVTGSKSLSVEQIQSRILEFFLPSTCMLADAAVANRALHEFKIKQAFDQLIFASTAEEAFLARCTKKTHENERDGAELNRIIRGRSFATGAVESLATQVFLGIFLWEAITGDSLASTTSQIFEIWQRASRSTSGLSEVFMWEMLRSTPFDCKRFLPPQDDEILSLVSPVQLIISDAQLLSSTISLAILKSAASRKSVSSCIVAAHFCGDLVAEPTKMLSPTTQGFFRDSEERFVNASLELAATAKLPGSGPGCPVANTELQFGEKFDRFQLLLSSLVAVLKLEPDEASSLSEASEWYRRGHEVVQRLLSTRTDVQDFQAECIICLRLGGTRNSFVDCETIGRYVIELRSRLSEVSRSAAAFLSGIPMKILPFQLRWQSEMTQIESEASNFLLQIDVGSRGGDDGSGEAIRLYGAVAGLLRRYNELKQYNFGPKVARSGEFKVHLLKQKCLPRTWNGKNVVDL